MSHKQAVADTGFIVALTNSSDLFHNSAREIFANFSQIILPQTTLTEICFLLRRDVGGTIVSRFLDRLSYSRIQLVNLNDNDIKRTAQLLRQYQDSRIDFVDASVMAVAERLNILTILTLDRRDFGIVRPEKWDFFELLP